MEKDLEMVITDSEAQWLQFEALTKWSRHRFRVKNMTDEDFCDFLWQNPRPPKNKNNNKEEQINNNNNNMKKKKKKNKNTKKEKKDDDDENKKNKKRKREEDDDEKKKEEQISNNKDKPCGDDQVEEEEDDDFDHRCASLPTSLLMAVKRVHMAMAMEKYKKELECRDTQEPKNDSHI